MPELGSTRLVRPRYSRPGSVAGSWAHTGSFVLICILVIYFYAHYFFASTTAHALAMFPPFVALLVGVGAPPAVVVYSLVFLNNLMAGLTHYGTTTSPVIFIEGYVGFRDWWRTGFVMSLLNLVIWLGLGIAWWKVLGIW